MPDNLYLVLSKPPEGVSAEEYDRWYHHHVRENILSPGFLNARRFSLDPAYDETVRFSHLAAYEYEEEVFSTFLRAEAFLATRSPRELLRSWHAEKLYAGRRWKEDET